MRRALLAVVALGLGISGSALADHYEPKKKLRKQDTARANAMLLKRADLTAGWTVDRSPTPDLHLTCKALDESDLTLTGEAESPDFTRGTSFVSSVAGVYATRAQATTSWKRGTSAAGIRCLRSVFARELASVGVKSVQLKKISFPRVSERTVALRLVASVTVQGQTGRIYIDVVVLQQSRAQAAVLLGSVFVPPPKSEAVGLANIVATRMVAAMRGA